MLFFHHLTAVASGFFRHYRHWTLGLSAVLVITLIIASLRSLTYMQVLEAKTLDARFALNQPPQNADQVVMIGIDDASLKFFGDNGVSWPWPRTFYAHVVDYLTRCGARAVLFDLLFYQPDLDRSESDGRETDNAFAQAIAKNGHVILGAQLSEDKLGFDTKMESVGLDSSFAELPMPSNYQSILAPIPSLSQAAAGLGIINIAADPDGIIRKVPLVYGIGNKVLPQIAIAGYLFAGN
ncbi:MAG: CHASE2 domain-containing protein, partial [Desulfobacteraceae bacterium]